MLVTFRYRPRNSFIQRFDPRAWLIHYGAFIASTLFFWDVRLLSLFMAWTLFVIFTSGVSFREMRRAWLFIGSFLVFYSVLIFLTGRGGTEVFDEEHILMRLAAPFTLFGWQPALNITAERISFAVSQFVRVFSLAGMTILIPYSLNPSQYGIAFRGLGLPDKFAYAMDLTMRFIPTFGRDFQLTMDAQRARGYEIEKLSGGLFEQVRKLAPLVIPVTIHAIIGSEDIIDAMDLRAFGVGERTWLEQLQYQSRDRVLIVGSVVLILTAILLATLGIGQFWVPDFLLRMAETASF